MSYGPPEIEQTLPCPHCAARAVFRAVARPGQREQPVFLRCCECGRERADLEFSEQIAA
jgi:uncharacterized Zn finger protein